MTTDERLGRVKEDIRKRLREVCRHLSEEDFEALVHKIAMNDVRPLSPSWPRAETGKKNTG